MAQLFRLGTQRVLYIYFENEWGGRRAQNSSTRSSFPQFGSGEAAAPSPCEFDSGAVLTNDRERAAKRGWDKLFRVAMVLTSPQKEGEPQPSD